MTTAALVGIALPNGALAGPPEVVQNPSYDPTPEPVRIDFSSDARPEDRPRFDRNPPSIIRFEELGNYVRAVEDVKSTLDPVEHSLPDGLEQLGGMVVPAPMLDGAAMVPDATRSLTAGPDPQDGGPDLSEICAFPEEVPPGVYDYDYRPGGEIPRHHTVYLNFVGVPDGLSTGGENSAENMSNIARTGHPYPVYGGGEERAIAAAQAVASDFEQLAVRVVYAERPPKVLPYTMVMVGGHYSDTTAGPSGGVAPLDCEDFGQRNVCYAFQNNSPAASQANVISQEIGHTLGLGHTNASDSVMAAGYAPTQGGDLGFNNTCAPTIQVAGQSAACVGVNKCHCGIGEAQHDMQTLRTTFAPAGVDVVEPTIELLQPEDGAMYAPDEEVRVEFDPWDDFGGYGWKLLIENEKGETLVDQVDYERALVFDLVGLPPGTYTVTGLVQDHADHVATDSVTITIGEDPSTGGTGGGEGGATDDGADDTAGGDDGESDGDEDTFGSGSDGSAMDGGDADGCGCVTSRPSTPMVGLWLLGLLGLARRRR
ncbi:MAG: hypothetical protein AAF799_39965 [Myxococcota bacterium]